MKKTLFKLTAAIALAGTLLVACQSGPPSGQDTKATPAAAAPAIAPEASTQEPAHMTTFEQVVAMEKELSNWGRWGSDDERGTLNLVTPQKTQQAVRLVTDGIPVSLARFASLEKAIDDFNFGDTKHEMW